MSKPRSHFALDLECSPLDKTSSSSPSTFLTPLSTKFTKLGSKSQTATSGLTPAVKKRLHIYDTNDDEECTKKVCLDNLSQLKMQVLLPNCMYAIGFLYEKFIVKKGKSSDVNGCPEFFGNFKSPSFKKSFGRFIKALGNIVDNSAFKTAAIQSVLQF